MIIAIDGPAGAGKSTVACLLAKRLGFVYLDTGAMYRAVTLKILNNNIAIGDISKIVKICKQTRLEINSSKDGSISIFLDGNDVSEKIRSPKITQHVSDIAKIKGVRQQMLKLQRHIGRNNNSVVEGRDIGTVVFPDAEKKFYIDAQFSERVNRRHKELKQAGKKISQDEVDNDLRYRDHIDTTRSLAPLKKADDAIYVDTTDLTIEQVVNRLLSEVKVSQKG